MATNVRVLVLEDNPADAELMIHALQQEGFVVEWRRVETDADYCARLEPTLDLILADYSLPQFNALKALGRLQETDLDIPLIVVTGSISEEAAVECMKRGAADYLLKDRLARLGPAVAQAVERRRLRQEKHKTAERLHLQSAALEATANAILITDRDGRIAWVNPAFALLTGYTLEEIRGEKASVLKSGRHSAAFYRMLWATILSGQVWHGEVINRRKDGSLYTEEMTITPVRDHEGAVSHFIGVKQDVSERRRSEATLRDSEARYRSLYENMLNGVVYCRMLVEQGQPPDFVYLAVNKASESLTGLKNVVGRRVSEVIPGIRESDPELLEIYGRVAQTGVPERFETYVQALQMWFAISVYSPSKEHFVAVFDVITERKQAEAALLESRNALHTMVETSPLAIIVTDCPGIVTRWNAAAEDIFGWSVEETLGKPNPIIPPDKVDELIQVRGQILQGRTVIGYETERRRKDGARIAVSLSATALRDARGTVTGSWRSALADIRPTGSTSRPSSVSSRSWRPSAPWRAAWPTRSTTPSPGS